MNNTRANVITLLKQMADNAYAVSEIWREDGNEVMDEKSMAQYCAYNSAVNLLTNKEFFNKIWEIYNPEVKQ